MGRITGVTDDRGKFIYVSPEVRRACLHVMVLFLNAMVLCLNAMVLCLHAMVLCLFV